MENFPQQLFHLRGRIKRESRARHRRVPIVRGALNVLNFLLLLLYFITRVSGCVCASTSTMRYQQLLPEKQSKWLLRDIYPPPAQTARARVFVLFYIYIIFFRQCQAYTWRCASAITGDGKYF